MYYYIYILSWADNLGVIFYTEQGIYKNSSCE